jgi:hypothetical protein
MIQRIQSIWLLLAAITVSCLLFIPMVTATIGTTEYQVLASGLYQKIGNQSNLIKSSTPLLICVIAAALISVVNIFNFSNRNRQKLIARMTSILIIALSFLSSQASKAIPGGLESANYKVGMFLPIIGVLFCILAIRGINNDEKLIKAADRLR